MISFSAVVVLRVLAAFEWEVEEKGWTSLSQSFQFQVQQPVVFAKFDVRLPENWTVEALSSDSLYSNPVGQCRIDFDYFPDLNALSVQRMFKLNEPQSKANSYMVVRELFQTQQAFEEMTALLKKRP